MVMNFLLENIWYRIFTCLINPTLGICLKKINKKQDDALWIMSNIVWICLMLHPVNFYCIHELVIKGNEFLYFDELGELCWICSDYFRKKSRGYAEYSCGEWVNVCCTTRKKNWTTNNVTRIFIMHSTFQFWILYWYILIMSS